MKARDNGDTHLAKMADTKMTLFVLAAGKGSRLRPLTEHRPKCLVELGDGSNLLRKLMDAGDSLGCIERFVIIAGHGVEHVEASLSESQYPAHLELLYNPFYEFTGPVVSVWVALPWMGKADFLLCNGDTYYSLRALQAVAKGKLNELTLGVDLDAPPGPDSMKVKLDTLGRVQHVAKEIPPEVADGMSTGLLAVKGKEARHAFIKTVNEMVRRSENLTPRVVWHSILNSLPGRRVPVQSVRIPSDDWVEIDTADDLAHAHILVRKNRKQTDEHR